MASSDAIGPMVRAVALQGARPNASRNLRLGLLERIAARLRQISARTIDIEVEHRHRRLERRALAAAALCRRTFERLRDVLKMLCSISIASLVSIT
jgi:hypothetical protein